MTLEGLLGGLIKPAGAKPRTSPIKGFRNPAILAPGESWLLDFEIEATTNDWYPFNRTKIVDNNTSEIIEVRPNDGADFFTVLNRASEIHEGWVWRIRIINRGAGNIAADEIIVNVWTE
ncbi:MAG: hypothetical protein HWN68_13895 [Desulfobacterales bacterium]|nr:hypothetical protein [Desulfobacterales bacterium]